LEWEHRTIAISKPVKKAVRLHQEVRTPRLTCYLQICFQFALRKDLSCDELADDYDTEDDQEAKDNLENDPEQSSDIKHDERSSLGSLEWYRKPSRVTQLFLVSDKNFPRTLFAMAIMHAVTWAPFYFVILISPILTVRLPREVFLLSAWLGYSQSVITPVMIYLLSDRVYKMLNDLVMQFVAFCCPTKSGDDVNDRKCTNSIEV